MAKAKSAAEKRPRGRPATGQTPKRHFRMADSEYSLVVQAAELSHKGNVSEFIRSTVMPVAKKLLKK